MPKVKSRFIAPGFGGRLKLARAQAEMSQREAARATNGVLTAAYISRLEADARTPTIDAVWTLADALVCERDWLRVGHADDDGADELDMLRRTVSRQEGEIRRLNRIVATVRDAVNEGGQA